MFFVYFRAIFFSPSLSLFAFQLSIDRSNIIPIKKIIQRIYYIERTPSRELSKTSDFNFHPSLNSIIFLQLPAPSKNFTRKNAKSIHRSTNHARSENFENALFLLFLHIPNKIIHSARFKIHPFQKIPIPNIYINHDQNVLFTARLIR